jgi:hypothetical protein
VAQFYPHVAPPMLDSIICVMLVKISCGTLTNEERGENSIEKNIMTRKIRKSNGKHNVYIFVLRFYKTLNMT